MDSIPPFFTALEKGEITEGMVVIFRYQGPKGAPGMPEVRRRPRVFEATDMADLPWLRI